MIASEIMIGKENELPYKVRRIFKGSPLCCRKTFQVVALYKNF